MKHGIRFGLIIFGVAIFLPIVFHDRDNDAWVKWVYDYQTLIAGTAAVIAAAYTVLQMIKSDQLQETRHRQLLFTGLRRELMTAERLYDFFAQYFFFTEAYIGQYQTLRPKNAEEWTYPKRQAFWMAIDGAYYMGEALNDELVKASFNELPSDLLLQIGYAKARIATLRQKIPNTAPDGFDKSVMVPSGYDPEVDFLLQETREAVKRILGAIKAWQDGLRKIYED